MGIAYRVGLKSLRNSAHRFTDLEQLDDAREASHNPSSERDIRDWVAVGLARLPDEQRKVLELAYHLGHSCAEIAVTMNCSVGTVKTRMYHGRQKLKYMLPNLAGLSRNAVTAGNAKPVRIPSPGPDPYPLQPVQKFRINARGQLAGLRKGYGAFPYGINC
jgi:hypothetical protein